VKTGLAVVAVVAVTACLQATARPVCPIDDFYPASNPRPNIASVVADPKLEIVHDDEQLWFDFIDVDVKAGPGWMWVYEVTVLRNDKGSFRVNLLRARSDKPDGSSGTGVMDSRDLQSTLAERLHRGLIPILARTHYEASFVNADLRFECMGGSSMFATVAEVHGGFTELTGEARPNSKDSDPGSVQAMGRALRDYALHRIDEDGLEEPLKLVEAHARPDNEHAR
jgi:hypothetical protein